MRSPLYRLGAFKCAFALAQLLPRPATRKIASALAAWSLRRSPDLRNILRENLAIATGLAGPALDVMVHKNLRCFCGMLADYFRCAGDRAERASALVGQWDGWEHLAAARERGKGTIVVTGHLGHWELGGLLLALKGLPLTVVTLPEPSPELTRWREACRHRLGIGTIEVGPGHDFAFVEMLRVLKGNGCLAMLVDRPYAGTGTAVRQFGHHTQYSTGAAMLAGHTGAAVVPAFVLEMPDHRYRTVAGPAIEMENGPLRDTMQANVQRIADTFAALIRQHPEQWFNYVPLFSDP